MKTSLESLTFTDSSITTPENKNNFEATLQKIDEQTLQLDADKIKERILIITTELTLLKHRRKLKELLTDVLDFIENEKWLSLAGEIKKKTNTGKVTALNTSLHKEILGKNYRKIFEQECASLNALYSIDIKQEGEAGKPKKHLSVLGFQPGQILSEGEQKCIALADFFTEIEVSGISSGLIFDDPVTSLDHERRRLIAQRLARASKTKQVIVFTHDLSFLYDLKNEAESVKAEHVCHWVEKIENKPGIITLGKSPNLENDHLNTIHAEEKSSEARDIRVPADKRKQLLQEGMSKLRTCYEAFVLVELFNQVMTRFDRRIRPDKLKEVFVSREYINQVCEKHGYVSGFIDAHLESERANVPITIELLEKEIKYFQDFRKKYKTAKRASLQEANVH